MPLSYRIKVNKTGLLFPYECLGSNHGYYISNFSGKAFELLVRSILENRSLKEKIFKKLNLLDVNYDVETYWDNKNQIDLVVEHKTDRVTRIIECKWLSNTVSMNSHLIQQLINKQYPLPQGYLRKNYLVLSQNCSKPMLKASKEFDVGIITLEDLFE